MDCSASEWLEHRDDVAQTRCYLPSKAVFFNCWVTSSAQALHSPRLNPLESSVLQRLGHKQCPSATFSSTEPPPKQCFSTIGLQAVPKRYILLDWTPSKAVFFNGWVTSSAQALHSPRLNKVPSFPLRCFQYQFHSLYCRKNYVFVINIYTHFKENFKM